MTPETYAQTIIAPTLREYLEQPMDVRRAMLACMTLIHLHDVLKTNGDRPKQETATQFFQSLEKECPACWLIFVVGTAAKHMRHKGSGFVIDNLISRPPAIAGVAECGLSQIGDESGGVEAFEPRASVDSALINAFRFLSQRFFGKQFCFMPDGESA